MAAVARAEKAEQQLAAAIWKQSADYSKKHKLSKHGAATHLYTTLAMELEAAFEAAGPEYRDRVEAMLSEQGCAIDRSDDQTVPAYAEAEA